MWIIAGRQSAGRGRLARNWVSPVGNLYASALLVEPCAMGQGPQIGFVAGVALVEALREVAASGHDGAAEASFTLKWPNDVLCNGAKLAGILVEGLTLPGQRFAAIVGVGVNCASAPDGLAYPTASLASALGRPVDPAALFATLRKTFAATLARWSRGENFPAIREAWLESAAGLGGPIRVRRGEEARDGTFSGLDPDGRLQLRRPGGELELIEAGDIALASP